MSVVLFRVHEDNEFNRNSLSSLRAQLPQYNVVCVSYMKQEPTRSGVFVDAHIITADTVRALPYNVKLRNFDPDNVRGFSELPAMSFFRKYPNHDFYWIIEYDVQFSGRWSELFRELSSSDADFLGTTILSKSKYPDWMHWHTLSFKENPLPSQYCIKSFMPFARVSRAALTNIDHLYAGGLSGHPEATWPTTCAMSNLRIEDIGGHGPYTPPKWRGKHYTNTPLDPAIAPGTFICAPPYRKATIDSTELTSMLWHPVKS